MYSVVLMMAMTGGAEAPATWFSHGSCYGSSSSCYGSTVSYGSCTGTTYSSGCYGSSSYGGGCTGSIYSGSCSGYSHGHSSSHGCCGGGFFSHFKSGHGHKSYSCHGGCYGSAYEGGCTGGWPNYTYTGGWATYGCVGSSVIVTPATTVAPPTAEKPVEKKEEKKIEKKEPLLRATPAPATMVVNLPADAKLTIDGVPTVSTSTRRVFASPALATGREFHYKLRVEYVEDGRPVVVNREVAVRAGEEATVTIDTNMARVVSR